jgi:hypothetical protein
MYRWLPLLLAWLSGVASLFALLSAHHPRLSLGLSLGLLLLAVILQRNLLEPNDR